MANINIGTLEAMLVIRDQMGPALATAAKASAQTADALKKAEGAVKSVDEAMKKGGASAAAWSDAQQRAALKMERVHEEALKMNAEMKNVNDGAVRTAGNIRLAGESFDSAAKSIGVSTDAMRVLGPAADVASTGMSGLTKSAAGFNAASIGIAAAGFAIGSAIGSWLNTFPAVQKAADSLFHSMFQLVGLAGQVDKSATQGLGEFSKRMAESNAEAQKKQVESMRAMGASSKDIAELYKGTMTPELQKQLGLTKEAVKAEDARAAAVKKSAEAQKAFSEQVERMRSDKMIEEMANLPGFKTGLADALQGGGLAKEIDFSKLPGFGLPDQAATKFAFAGKAAVDTFAEMAQKMRDAKAPAQQIGEELMRVGASAEEAAAAIAGTSKAVGLMDSLKTAFKGLPQIILGAIQGGGDIFKAAGASIFGSMFAENTALTKSITAGLSKVLGSGIGGALGSIIPGLGTLLGSSLGGLVSKGISALGSKLGIGGNKAIMALNDQRDAFLASQGGFVELQKKLQGLSNQDLVKKIFDAKTVDQFNAAVSEVNRLLGAQEESQAALQDAVERYGFSIEELGPKFRQQELDEQAGQLLQDFRLLTASGIDQALVLDKMGANLSEYVQTAVRAGTTVPEAMRPMIEAAIQNGELLDENGQAYASAEAAGITFAQTMSEQFSSLIDKIGELVAALTGVPNVSRTVTVDTHYTGGGGAPDTGGGDYGGVPEDYRAASGFNAMVTKPTRILVGEAGPEHVKVTPQGQMAEAGGVTGRGGITVNAAFNGDPTQTHEGRKDLASFQYEQLVRQLRADPLIRQYLRTDGGR